jgi:hypothetical protein
VPLVHDCADESRGEFDSIAAPKPAGRPDQCLPTPGGRFRHQRRFDRDSAPPAEEPCRQHPGVVQHQQITGPQQPGQIAHPLIFQPLADNEQPGRIARARGVLRDRFGRQRKIEFLDSHRTRSLLERVHFPAGRALSNPVRRCCGTLVAEATRIHVRSLRDGGPTHAALAKYAAVCELLAGAALSRNEDGDRLVDLLREWTERLGLPRRSAYGMSADDVPCRRREPEQLDEDQSHRAQRGGNRSSV